MRSVYFLAWFCAVFMHPAEAVDRLGCYKTACPSSSTDVRRKLSTSIARSIEWIHDQQNLGIWVDIPTSAWITTNIIMSGYVHDDVVCSGAMLSITAVASRSLGKDGNIAGDRWPFLLLVLKATCQPTGKKVKRRISTLMRKKLRDFPRGTFNNFYQYSLAIVALYVNNEQIPMRQVERLMQYLLNNNNKKNEQEIDCTSDTKCMVIIALSAVIKQKALPIYFKEKGETLIKQAVSDIERQIAQRNIQNLITLSHAIQVLQIHCSPLTETLLCGKLMSSLIANQNVSGSFGDLMTTAGMLAPLSGVSLLDLKYFKCTDQKNIVMKSNITQFAESQKIRIEIENDFKRVSSPTSVEMINVEVRVSSEVDGINFMANTWKVTSKFGINALEAMDIASSRDECFKYHVKKTSWGRFVDMVCGIEQNDDQKTYWMFYVNGKTAEVGPEKYILKNKDNISFRYMKSN